VGNRRSPILDINTDSRKSTAPQQNIGSRKPNILVNIKIKDRKPNPNKNIDNRKPNKKTKNRNPRKNKKIKNRMMRELKTRSNSDIMMDIHHYITI